MHTTYLAKALRLLPAALCLLGAGACYGSDEQQAIHLLNRLGYGPRPGDVEQVMKLGVDAYIDQQLHPDKIPLPDDLNHALGGFDTLKLTPQQLFLDYGPQFQVGGGKPTPEQQKARRERARRIVDEAQAARVLRAVESPRQLQEVMVDFWFNHFNVYDRKGLDELWVGAYERDAIRPYALGSFHDLLFATAKSPAMLFYLDNWQNTAPNDHSKDKRFSGINENYAREIMELHTLGIDGGYTQTDVTDLAHILTGWGLCRERGRSADPGGFCFDAKRHDDSAQPFLGQRINSGDEWQVEQALDMLAASPATAKHLSFQLAQYFVADQPPSALVDRLTQTWLSSNGDIAKVLDTLFHSPEFWSTQYRGNKFKTPYQYVVSMLRAQGSAVSNFKPVLGMMRSLGQPLYGCLTPDGYKNTQDAWLNPDAMMTRLSYATALGAGKVRLMGDADMPDPKPEQVTAALYATLHGLFTPDEILKIDAQPAPLRPGLILGSPEFQYR